MRHKKQTIKSTETLHVAGFPKEPCTGSSYWLDRSYWQLLHHASRNRTDVDLTQHVWRRRSSAADERGKNKGGRGKKGKEGGPPPSPLPPRQGRRKQESVVPPRSNRMVPFPRRCSPPTRTEATHQAMMMRTLVVAMMLASASSFAPSPKTQLATRRPAQAAPRVMPAMKLEPGNPLYYIGFPSQYQKDDMIREVCPYHYAPLWNPIASLELLASLELAPGVPPSPPWSSSPPWTPAPHLPVALSTTSVSAQANKKKASDFFLVVCILTGFVCGELYLMF